jgi:hypothetical protein
MPDQESRIRLTAEDQSARAIRSAATTFASCSRSQGTHSNMPLCRGLYQSGRAARRNQIWLPVHREIILVEAKVPMNITSSVKIPKLPRLVDALGRHLYETMEHLDPSGIDEHPEAWENLPERSRDFYRHCVSQLLSDLSNHGMILRSAEVGE